MLGTGNQPSSHRYLSYADGIAARWQDSLLLIGRVMAGWIFVQSGWRKLGDVPAFAGSVVRRGVHEFLGYLAPFVEFIGGAGLVLGLGGRYAALLLVAFTIMATYTSHLFWTYPEAQRGQQFTQFWKNVSMIGGLVALFVAGPGRYSVDGWLRRR